MNVILPNRANKKVVDMINFVHNEHEIINKNMPFMIKKKTNKLKNSTLLSESESTVLLQTN